MVKLLVNNLQGIQEIIEVEPSGDYNDQSRVLWDERKHGPLPSIQLGGMIAEDEIHEILDENGDPLLDLEGNPQIYTTRILTFNQELFDESESSKEQSELDEAWVSLRSQRDKLLANSDFTQLSDAPLSSEEKALWATYRQALRDLPQNTQDPRNVIFPESP